MDFNKSNYSSRMVSPPINEITDSNTFFNENEKKVFLFLHETLPLEWEIYTKPHLNGLKPHFIILNPNVGIAVFEMISWNLTKLDYKFEYVNENNLIIVNKNTEKKGNN